MKKLLLSLAAVFSLLLILVSCKYESGIYLQYNQELTDNGLICTLSDDKSYYSVTRAVNHPDNNLVIPSQINSKPVKIIENGALREKLSIKSVVIPETVTKIGDSAFEECYWLESVVIPNSVTSIGENAFYGCSRIENFDIPDGLTSISKGMLAGCESLKSIDIPDGITSIESYAFLRCLSLERIVIPNSVTSIGNRAFSECASLESVVIPEGVTSISDGAFSGCASLKSIVIPEGVTNIGAYAFSDCTSLESIVIPNSVTDVGGRAFEGCSSLVGIDIPDNVTSIGERAFFGCTSLLSAEIGGSVTDIKLWAFQDCVKLVEIIDRSQLGLADDPKKHNYLHETVLEIHNGKTKIVNLDGYLFYTYDDKNYFVGYIGEETEISLPESYNEETYMINEFAFYDCDSIVSAVIPDGAVTSIGRCAFKFCDSLKSVVVDNGVTHVDFLSFSECSALESVSFPCSVSDIDRGIFYRCSSLVNIEVDEENPYYKSIDGNLYTKDCKTIVRYALGKADNSFSMPDDVTNVGDMAFYDCSSLVSIEIPDSVKSIGEDAFYGCSSLIDIDIPDSVTEICDRAFSRCTSLKSIEIPCSVTSIGNGAFYGCSSLETITLPLLENEKYDQKFTNFGYIFGSEYDNKYVPASLKHVVITGGDTIASGAFRGCSSIESIAICSGITNIGCNAFDACDSLVSIEVDEENLDYKSIDGNLYTKNGKYLVRYASGKTDGRFVIPDGVTRIVEGALYGCKSLKSIFIPKTVIYIEKNAVYCPWLEDVYYAGSEGEWRSIFGGGGNGFNFATKHYGYISEN